MASIEKFHVASCTGKNCECLWGAGLSSIGHASGLSAPGPLQDPQAGAERFHIRDARRKHSLVSTSSPPRSRTFREIAEDWFQSKTDRRPSHVSDLRTRLDKHILPIFGRYKLDRITVASIEKLRNDLRDRGYARRTINAILRIIGAVFKLGGQARRCAPGTRLRASNAQRQWPKNSRPVNTWPTTMTTP